MPLRPTTSPATYNTDTDVLERDFHQANYASWIPDNSNVSKRLLGFMPLFIVSFTLRRILPRATGRIVEPRHRHSKRSGPRSSRHRCRGEFGTTLRCHWLPSP